MFKKLFSRNKTIEPSINSNGDGTIEYMSTHDAWLVRWTSRYGSFHDETKDEVEIFLDENEAKFFKSQLELSYKLLKHTSGTDVTLEKNV